MKHILILNGPNLNLLGLRQPEIYGRRTLTDLMDALRKRWPDVRFTEAHSNHEGDLIDLIHATQYGGDNDRADGIVFNAGAYTHTSLALADAIASVTVPVIEVHISNVAAREEIRRRSMIAPVCRGTIAGLGLKGYALAVEALLNPEL